MPTVNQTDTNDSNKPIEYLVNGNRTQLSTYTENQLNTDVEAVDKLADKLVDTFDNAQWRTWYCGVINQFGTERVEYWLHTVLTGRRVNNPGALFGIYVKNARAKEGQYIPKSYQPGVEIDSRILQERRQNEYRKRAEQVARHDYEADFLIPTSSYMRNEKMQRDHSPTLEEMDNFSHEQYTKDLDEAYRNLDTQPNANDAHDPIAEYLKDIPF
ncbi:MAG: hypothetical protein ABIQ04_01630 [Candidatus Saccharimonadales bacterium]